jgi:hypothetical protein
VLGSLRAAPAAQTLPPIRISEVHAAPKAVLDQVGEWVELTNLGDTPIDLQGWALGSNDSELHRLMLSLVIQPGQYIVLANSGDPAQNGGVQPNYVYNGPDLGNLGDAIWLLDPGGQEVDRVQWGEGTALAMPQGASLERQGPDGAWAPAHSAWPGSTGDLGSPGAAYQPPPTPTPLPTATPLPTPPPNTPPRVMVSELMIDPGAVDDDLGEWVELANLDPAPVNLLGWTLADLDRDRHTVQADLWLQPGQYVVLARHGDSAQNGGVAPAYVYNGFQLGNEGDELLLLAPWGVEVDRAVWQGGAAVRRGASLERTGFDASGGWVPAHAAWPGSAGDLGSPGAGYLAPTPTPVPTASSTPTETPSPPPTATPLPPTETATPLPGAWPLAAEPGALVIDEVYYQTADQEFIVLRNTGAGPLDLTGWLVGDAALPGEREGLLALPAGVSIAPGALYVLARNGTAFSATWGRAPDAEWNETGAKLPVLARRTDLASGEVALNDNGDELLLLDPQGRVADAVAFGDGDFAAVGLAGNLRTGERVSLQRAPGAAYPTVRDVRHRFLLAAPDPFAAQELPSAQPHAPVALAGGLQAAWGSLGAYSTFSPDGIAPPHYLLAAAGAHGLDFLAIADADRDPLALVTAGSGPAPALLPAWRWQNAGGDEAIVYTAARSSLLSWADLLDFLAGQGGLAQALDGEAPVDDALAIVAADEVEAPGGVGALPAAWLAAGTPLLPAGNTNPPLPGTLPAAPRYTGLAVQDTSTGSLQAALAARRGWLTSTPSLWLTLQTADGNWMGSSMPPSNELALDIAYGDAGGAPAGLALWQDGAILRQLDQPSPDGRWRVTIAPAPGSFLFAVATQLDGDFAITAPLYIQPASGGALLLNEVLPKPGTDHNGDGAVDSSDEYVELYNPGSAPLALTGYQLSDTNGDENGRRANLGAGRVIGAGERLLLWRADTGLSLNDDGDRLTLWDPGGAQVDSVAWSPAPADGRSLSRIPDGGSWQRDTPATPGEPNQPPPAPVAPAEPPPAPPDEDDGARDEDNRDDEDDEDDDGDEERDDALPPTYGQATGPPASLAAAKLQGLEAGVEFRAQVVVPPGLFNNSIYVAEPARTLDGVTLPIAALGIHVYLQGSEFLPMQEGDWVLVRGVLQSFRGEMEVRLREPGQLWPIEAGAPLLPLPVQVGEIGESLEGRLVTFNGMVTGWQGDSLYLGDPAAPDVPAVRVTVRSSLGWRRPYVQKGEVFQVIGVVSQFARTAPWNGGYRVLVRYPSDLVQVDS